MKTFIRIQPFLAYCLLLAVFCLLLATPAFAALAVQTGENTTTLLTQLGITPEVAAAVSAVISALVTLLVALKVIRPAASEPQPDKFTE